jgi:hypothetical protein
MKTGIILFYLIQKRYYNTYQSRLKKYPQYEIYATVFIRLFLLKAFPVQRLAQWFFNTWLFSQ